MNALAYGRSVVARDSALSAGNRRGLSRPWTVGRVPERDRTHRAPFAARARSARPRDSAGTGGRRPAVRLGAGGAGHRSVHHQHRASKCRPPRCGPVRRSSACSDDPKQAPQCSRSPPYSDERKPRMDRRSIRRRWRQKKSNCPVPSRMASSWVRAKILNGPPVRARQV